MWLHLLCFNFLNNLQKVVLLWVRQDSNLLSHRHLIYSQARLSNFGADPFFNLKYVKDHVFKNSLQIYKEFFNYPNIFQYFFSHEKRNRTFITTIITTARRFTIKLPHGVILLTFMTLMQRRGLEPLHPVFTTGALPTELTDAPSLQEDINLKTFREFYIAHPNVSDPQRFLVSYWVANPITYDLKQVISDGLVNSLQRFSVNMVGFEPTQPSDFSTPLYLDSAIVETPKVMFKRLLIKDVAHPICFTYSY